MRAWQVLVDERRQPTGAQAEMRTATWGSSPGSTHADRVELRIVDHGRDVSKRDIDSVLTPFQRLGDRDTTTGVGLSLSVAEGFIDAMNGTIRAEETREAG